MLRYSFGGRRGRPDPLARLRRARISLRPVLVTIVSLAMVSAAGDIASAASTRAKRSVAAIQSRNPGEPILAIVSLRNQQITVYDADGWILRAPVSSGQKGRETPAGVFSIIEKEAEHYSNLYDDAFMPNMQRITWSGIALHGGVVPGYPASHGCIRMPYDFAQRLFALTKLGMRVIVAPGEVVPVPIDHPALFQPPPDAAAIAAARAAEADAAASKADQARLGAVKAFQEAARARVKVRTLENLKRMAEARLAPAGRPVASAESAETKVPAEDAKAEAVVGLAELEAQLAGANAELQPKLDALVVARQAAVAAETARAIAAEAARKVALDREPVSVFVSRKARRLYVRRAFQPILDIPVTIRDADRPIGTYVFTAMASRAGGTDMRWSVVSLTGSDPDGGIAELQRSMRRGGEGGIELISTDLEGAKAALDRIAIPQDTVDQIAAMISPRSSLIVSDEELSSETGNGTEFVIILSGEPQGGLRHRRRHQDVEVRYDRPGDRLRYWRSPFVSPFSTW
jgi:hypothetical protein